MNHPSVDIVIPCLNESAYIKACVRSVLMQAYPKEKLKVWVVDGMSNDGTKEILNSMLKEESRLEVLENPERVTPVSLNLGIHAGTAEVVIILGAHAELEADFVVKNVQALSEHPDAGCAGGMILNLFENKEAEIISAAMASPFGVGNARFRTGGEAGYVDTVAFGAYRRSVLDEIGLFDEGLVRNQDDELNYRLTKNGHKIWFDPEIRSRYYVRGSYKKVFSQYRQYGYWKVFVNVKHKNITTWRQLIPFLWVCFLIGGGVLSVVFPVFKLAWLAGVLFYGVVGVVMAVKASKAVVDFPSVMYAFILLHLAYGIGYAEGVWEFALLGRKPKRKAHQLTR
jgi:cellulose synthase/poly-beta-1,6-N-acetylglucosamine synthase-like glycosyltransferase